MLEIICVHAGHINMFSTCTYRLKADIVLHLEGLPRLA